MKKQSGVTMLELVLALVVIIIIASFAVYSGKDALDQAKAAEVYAEISSIREAANGINVKKEMNSDFVLTKGVHYDEKATEITASKADFETEYNLILDDEEYSRLYVIYGMDELEKYQASSVKNEYGLDAIKHSYIVNFDDVRVDLLRSVSISDRNVKTFDQIRELVDDGQL